ncbi:MAG: helix-turn-helix transcriptional regulator [Clostridia bacterium]|nr:helix-turn-helix transcriptional regulator [Clostridia bacterium]
MRIYRKGEAVDFKYAKSNVDIYGMTFHSCYEIYLFLQGEAEYISPVTRQKLLPFQLIIIPPDEYHQILSYGNKTDYERFVMNIEPHSELADILRETVLSKKTFLLQKNHRIVQNFLYLKSCFENLSEKDFSRVLSAISTDTVVLLKYCNDTFSSCAEGLSETALRTMNYVNAHFTECFDLEFLAEKMFCSVSLLCHEFKNNFGISIKKYIEQKRINLANFELLNGVRPENVCLNSGFSNYPSFFRIYKRYFGVSPSETYKSSKNKKAPTKNRKSLEKRNAL